MKRMFNHNVKRIMAMVLALFIVLSDTTSATPFISTKDIPNKKNFEEYITKMYNLDESDSKYIQKLENAMYDYKNRYTMYVDHDYVLGKVNERQTGIVYYQPGVQDPPSSMEDPITGEIDAGDAVTPPCGEWYNDASGMEVDGEGQELYGGIKVYTALPWAPASNTYFFDTDVSTEDAYNWMNSQGSFTCSKTADWAKTANGRICKGVGYSVALQYLRPKDGTWQQRAGAYVSNIEGVECVGVAVPPAVVDPTYNDGFKPGTWQTAPTGPTQNYNYGHKKMCVVLEGDAGTIYLPCTNADAKGHTFPGGVMQTNVKAGGVNNNVYSVGVAATSGDAGGSTQLWPGNEVAHKMSTVTSAGAIPLAYTYNVCEAYGWSSTLLSTLKDNYRVIGYVVWP